MNEPLLQWVTDDKGAARSSKTGAGRWLDVRAAQRAPEHSIEGSLNIPLYFIPPEFVGARSHTPYVVYCDNRTAQLGCGLQSSWNGDSMPTWCRVG